MIKEHNFTLHRWILITWLFVWFLYQSIHQWMIQMLGFYQIPSPWTPNINDFTKIFIFLHAIATTPYFFPSWLGPQATVGWCSYQLSWQGLAFLQNQVHLLHILPYNFITSHMSHGKIIIEEGSGWIEGRLRICLQVGLGSVPHLANQYFHIT